MKRFSTLLSRPGGGSSRSSSSSSPSNIPELNNAAPDSPEAKAASAVRQFCESGGTVNRDEEVLHLPVIVDSAESSPTAATACAAQIRAYMGKQFGSTPHVQYNAVMLIRILSDHPGASFTRNFDEKFVKSIKDALRNTKDQNMQQLLRETLDALEANRSHDAGVQKLIQMWRKEKGSAAKLRYQASYGARDTGNPEQWPPQGDVYIHDPSTSRQRPTNRHQLPAPTELASRVEESRNTAKILIQLIQSTQAEELLANELIREFADRCQSAQRSMQTYINCDSPPPDDDTLQTLIETHEQLSLAGSRYQRAMLAARRTLGANTSPPQDLRSNSISHTPEPLESRLLTAPQSRQQQQQQQHSLVSPLAPSEPTLQSSLSNTSSLPPTMTSARATKPQATATNQQVGSHADDDLYDDLYDSTSAHPSKQQPANPFLDPVEHDQNPPPLAVEPARYGTTSQTPTSPSLQSFSNASSDHRPVSRHSPVANRPGPSPWHERGISASYTARQASAVNGVNMHGAAFSISAAELDGNSKVGRGDNEASVPRTFVNTERNVSPVEPRTSLPVRRISRVDVAGTGGFKAA